MKGCKERIRSINIKKEMQTRSKRNILKCKRQTQGRTETEEQKGGKKNEDIQIYTHSSL